MDLVSAVGRTLRIKLSGVTICGKHYTHVLHEFPLHCFGLHTGRVFTSQGHPNHISPWVSPIPVVSLACVEADRRIEYLNLILQP
jgi:hypothetical protein